MEPLIQEIPIWREQLVVSTVLMAVGNGIKIFSRERLKRLQALLCLLCMLAGPTAIVPELLAVASVIEGSHTTYAGITNGEFKLRLSHERGQKGRVDFLASHKPTSPLHHHGLASKILCTLAGSAPRQADHIANFSLGASADKAKRHLPSIPLNERVDAQPVPVACVSNPARTLIVHDRRANDAAPPDTPRLLRTTLLVI